MVSVRSNLNTRMGGNVMQRCIAFVYFEVTATSDHARRASTAGPPWHTWWFWPCLSWFDCNCQLVHVVVKSYDPREQVPAKGHWAGWEFASLPLKPQWIANWLFAVMRQSAVNCNERQNVDIKTGNWPKGVEKLQNVLMDDSMFPVRTFKKQIEGEKHLIK